MKHGFYHFAAQSCVLTPSEKIAFENIVQKGEYTGNHVVRQSGLYASIVMLYNLLGSVHYSNTINPFPNKPWFLRVCSTSLLETLWEKEKLLVMSNFSFSHSVFYLFKELSAIFIALKIVVCKLFQFGRV